LRSARRGLINQTRNLTGGIFFEPEVSIGTENDRCEAWACGNSVGKLGGDIRGRHSVNNRVCEIGEPNISVVGLGDSIPSGPTTKSAGAAPAVGVFHSAIE
jgi:hypothetical protein